MVGLIGGGRDWSRTAKGWFLEFRLIPVLLWSYTAVVLGTAVASADLGGFDPLWFAVALGLGGLIQGWATHAINEIYDWRSGTDRIDGPRALSGGSHVRNLSLLGEGDLWLIFAASSGAIATLTIWVVVARAAWLAMLVLAGYILGVAYTVPPIATAYRPFAGEWFGGFPGVLLSGLGAYAIQTRQLSIVAVLALSAHALVCMGMLIVHHYLDAQMDARALPQKRTSVVALGFRNAKRYAAAMTAVGAILFGALALAVRREFIFGALFTAPAVWIHLRIRPTDLKSVTRGELQVIQLGIAAGLSTAVALAPSLWPMIPLAAAGYLVHLAVVSPPAELARAWRRGPSEKKRTTKG